MTILSTLQEYCRIMKKIDEPFYIKNVRLSRLPIIHKIIKKMKNRTEKEFPDQWIY